MQSKIVFREVKERDNVSLASMIRGVFLEHDAPQEGTVYSDPTTDNLYQLFRIYPTIGLDPGCAELVKFYLAKESRGLGIGSSLMQRCIHSARENGYSKLYLESLPHFSKALSIYSRLGFRRLSLPMGSSGHTSCNIWMLMDL